jgi:uncharacterized SAM-binding protein YcdF (DUF218 family)
MLRIKEFFKDATQNHFFGSTPKLQSIDIGIVFGNRHITAELASSVAADFKEREIGHLIICGGVKLNDGRTEADTIANLLIKDHQIPPDRILLDRISSNTCENAEQARRIINESVLDTAPASILGFGHAKAGMRFLWTLEKFFPSSVSMFQQVHPEMQDDVTLSAQAVEQSMRLPFYAAMNYIKPVTLATIKQRIKDYRDAHEPY